MVKEQPDIVGEVDCLTPGCECIAQVRQRSNGQRLYYLYCPDCKQNPQSGPAMQNYLSANMRPVGTGKVTESVDAANDAVIPEPDQTETKITETENQTMAEPVTEQNQIAPVVEKDKEPDFWRPQSQAASKVVTETPTQTKTKPVPVQTETKNGLTQWQMVGFGVLGVSVLAVIWLLIKRLGKPAPIDQTEPAGA